MEGAQLLGDVGGRALPCTIVVVLHTARALLGDVRGGVRVEYDLDEADLITGRHAAIRRKTQVETLPLPLVLHDADDL